MHNPQQNISDGLLRIWHILGTKEDPGLIPICRSTWWTGVASGRFPKPVRIGKRAVAWRASDIRELISTLNNTEGEQE
jgi:predicted DNA-binding transcriptional regulator AlpA